MGYYLPILTGALLSLSFSGTGTDFFAWFALAPLLFSVRDKTPAASFREGFIAGVVFNFLSVYWVTRSMHDYGGMSYPASVLVLVLLALYLAIYFGAFALLFTHAARRGRALAYVMAPALWVCLELCRNYLFSGFPWNLLGYSQHGWPGIIQVSDVTGVYGVSALVVLINVAVADIISMLRSPGPPKVSGYVAPLLALVVLAGSYGYGSYALARIPEPSGFLKVALIQGNIDQSMKWDPAFQRDVLDTYEKLTLEAADARPDIVFWPETATPFYFQDRALSSEVAALARKTGTYILTGSPSFKKLEDESFVDYNSAYLLSPDGEVAGRYDKLHLVPFGEYVPLKKLLFFVSRMVTSIADFGTGGEYTVFEAGKVRFSVMICFEVIFPELAREFTLAGAGLLATITNDAWFGRSAAPYQHFNMAVFRAVENKRALVRAANTGISGVILPSGRVAEVTPIFTRGIVTANVPLYTQTTFYTRHGDLFAYACTLAAALFVLFVLLKGRSER